MSDNPFNDDPALKEMILSKEGKSGQEDSFELIEEDNPDSTDLKPYEIPKAVKNIILDASALAKNEKEAKAMEMSLALNDIFTRYNREFKTDLQVDFDNLSRTLVNVSDPKRRRILELYVSEVFKSIRPIMILHMISRLTLALDYVLDPTRMFDSNNLSVADLFTVIEKLLGYIESLNEMASEVSITGSDLELARLASEKELGNIDSDEVREVSRSFFSLLKKEKGIE